MSILDTARPTGRLTFAGSAVLTTLLLVTGCGSGTGSEPAAQELSGRTFIGDQVTVDDEPYPLVKGSQIRLTFEDGTVGASAGCNSMGGDADWSDGTLQVDALAMTEMACDEDLMDQDTWLADLLSSGPALSQDRDSLTLTSDGTVVTLTDEEVAVPDASLTGTTWQLDSIITGDTASSVPAGVTSTLVLKKSGLAFAELGCNTGRAGYTFDAGTITFEPMATTRMACDGAAMEVEAAVAAVLQDKVTYTIDGASLNVTSGAGGGGSPDQLVYRAG